ncbi:MAG: NlpC/P60 family protein [Betaproteobacteria bacterium]|nr:MAG: NlpC/P60 family protein [Betaproteobacteria bacterium]
MGGAALFRIVAGLMSLALAACASAPVARVDSRGAGAADQALKMVGKPYRFGGSTPAKGFDCSGLVQYSFRQAGVALPRDTEQQRRASAGIRVSSLRRGDLVFFNEGWRRNSHVGIYLGSGKFVHAPSSGGHVRTESLDSPYWKKHLSEARRV